MESRQGTSALVLDQILNFALDQKAQLSFLSLLWQNSQHSLDG